MRFEVAIENIITRCFIMSKNLWPTFLRPNLNNCSPLLLSNLNPPFNPHTVHSHLLFCRIALILIMHLQELSSTIFLFFKSSLWLKKGRKQLNKKFYFILEFLISSMKILFFMVTGHQDLSCLKQLINKR